MYILMATSMALILTFYFINKLEYWDSKMNSSFECGFSVQYSSRYSYSISYFFISIIFLYLDLEFCLLFPFFIFSLKSQMVMNLFLIIFLMIFLIILMEWKKGMISWLE